MIVIVTNPKIKHKFTSFIELKKYSCARDFSAYDAETKYLG